MHAAPPLRGKQPQIYIDTYGQKRGESQRLFKDLESFIRKLYSLDGNWYKLVSYPVV